MKINHQPAPEKRAACTCTLCAFAVGAVHRNELCASVYFCGRAAGPRLCERERVRTQLRREQRALGLREREFVWPACVSSARCSGERSRRRTGSVGRRSGWLEARTALAAVVLLLWRPPATTKIETHTHYMCCKVRCRQDYFGFQFIDKNSWVMGTRI